MLRVMIRYEVFFLCKSPEETREFKFCEDVYVSFPEDLYNVNDLVSLSRYCCQITPLFTILVANACSQLWVTKRLHSF